MRDSDVLRELSISDEFFSNEDAKITTQQRSKYLEEGLDENYIDNLVINDLYEVIGSFKNLEKLEIFMGELLI